MKSEFAEPAKRAKVAHGVSRGNGVRNKAVGLDRATKACERVRAAERFLGEDDGILQGYSKQTGPGNDFRRMD